MIINEGRCDDEFCNLSHTQKDLEVTCKVLSEKLKNSKYNVDKVNTNQASSADGDADADVSEDNDKGIDDCASSADDDHHYADTDGSEDSDDKGMDDKYDEDEDDVVDPETPKKHRFYKIGKVNETNFYQQFSSKNHEEASSIDESNLLTQDTWQRMLSVYPKHTRLLIIGSPHKAEIQILEKHFIIQILEYR